MLAFYLVYPDFSFGQISRGADEEEIYVTCPMYNDPSGYFYHGLFRSTDNGEDLSLQHSFNLTSYVKLCLADAFEGVVYNIRDSALDKSTDFGITWNSFYKPEGIRGASGNMPGEIYVAGSSVNSLDLYRSSDFGFSWIPVTSLFSMTNRLLDVGSVPGEIYAIVFRPLWDTIELKFSNNYGTTFSSIFIDTSLILNPNLFGGPFLTHGTFQGEYYLIRQTGNADYYLFHTIDNGNTFEYQSTLPYCEKCYDNYEQRISFSAGRTPGSFYYMRAQELDTLGGQLITNLCIDYSSDYGKTFETHCYFLDSLFTGTGNSWSNVNTVQLKCNPNPLSPNTEVYFDLPKFGTIDLSIYDLQGTQVATLVHGRKPEGGYSIPYNGKDVQGTPLAPGVYILSLKVDGIQMKTQKVVVMK
jgi:hypothetical protein